MNEHDTIVLERALPEHGLEAGDVGAIVHVHGNGNAFEVEFVAGSGSTIAVVTLAAEDVRPVATSEILHVRNLPVCLLYTSPSPRDQRGSRMPSSA